MSSIVVNIDVADFDGNGLDIIGTEAADTLFGTNDGELIDGLAGDDFLSGSDGDDFILGGEDNDTIGGGAGADTILGGNDGDLIFAYDGDDVVDAGEGNDIIYSGKGSDILFGGAGQDEFVFELEDFAEGEVDIIADFEQGEDKLIIKGLSPQDTVSFDSATGTISVNGDEVISFDGNDSPEDFELF
ncbi:MAG: hypothetical protein AAFR77_16850 [Cyanobacteria bacterium J06631_2]